MKYFKKLLSVGLLSTLLISNLQATTLTGILENQTTLVPLKIISDELGASLSSNPTTKRITLTYGEQIIELTPNDKTVSINGITQQLPTPPKVVNGTTYVPLRFLGEALGGSINYTNGSITLQLNETTKTWDLNISSPTSPATTTIAFQQRTHKINNKSVQTLTINMNDPRIKVNISTAGNKINKSAPLQEMAKSSKAHASINGTYFAAYNGDMPLPDGTLVQNGKPLHITDIGCTVGFTPEGKVLIDFVTTRVQGYINSQLGWTSYRINRPTPDTSATVLYTPEYVGNIPLATNWTAIVCQDGKVIKKTSNPTTVPSNGFILTTPASSSSRFNMGDSVNYEVSFTPRNNSSEDWKDVTNALSAGPSLLINNKPTTSPKEEGFSESKILTQSAQRSFIGVTSDNQVIIGTTSATIKELKSIAKQLGLKNAMCLDGGASSGLYYNNQFLTTPGRPINNTINFIYN